MNSRFLLALMLTAQSVSAQPLTGAANPVLTALKAKAKTNYLSHKIGDPYIDQVVVVAATAVDKKDFDALKSALGSAREVQEGCAAPCAGEADEALYKEKVKLAAADLGLSGGDLTAAVNRYFENGKPRLRSGGSTQGPSKQDLRAMESLLAGQRLSEGQRQQMTSKAGKWAALLNEQRSAGEMGTGRGSIVAGGTNLTKEDRDRLVEIYKNTPTGDSRHNRTLTTKAPPKMQPVKIEHTWGEKLALWVDDKVGSQNIETAANFSAGFGDKISFGFSGWARRKTCGYECANVNSEAYFNGEVAGVVHTLAMGGAAIFKPLTVGAVTTVARWAPAVTEAGAVLRQGQFVMAGTKSGVPGFISWLKAGGPELAVKHGAQYLKSGSVEVAAKALRYPIKEEGLIMGFAKGLMGQRVYTGPPNVVALAL